MRQGEKGKPASLKMNRKPKLVVHQQQETLLRRDAVSSGTVHIHCYLPIVLELRKMGG